MNKAEIISLYQNYSKQLNILRNDLIVIIIWTKTLKNQLIKTCKNISNYYASRDTSPIIGRSRDTSPITMGEMLLPSQMMGEVSLKT